MLQADQLDFDGRKRGKHRRQFGTDYIETRFIEAAETLRKLPDDRRRGYSTLRLETVQDSSEAYGYNEITVREIATSDQITKLDEVLRWSHEWLPERDRLIVWGIASGAGFDRLSAKFKKHRTTIWRYYTAALMHVAEKLERLQVKNNVAK